LIDVGSTDTSASVSKISRVTHSGLAAPGGLGLKRRGDKRCRFSRHYYACQPSTVIGAASQKSAVSFISGLQLELAKSDLKLSLSAEVFLF
jgi:hypothetical protein